MAPGSIGDLSSGGVAYPLPYPAGSEAVPVGAVWAITTVKWSINIGEMKKQEQLKSFVLLY